jgi:hypothetical protein
MPKHLEQKIGQSNADHEKNGQMEIHIKIMDRTAGATLIHINAKGRAFNSMLQRIPHRAFLSLPPKRVG